MPPGNYPSHVATVPWGGQIPELLTHGLPVKDKIFPLNRRVRVAIKAVLANEASLAGPLPLSLRGHPWPRLGGTGFSSMVELQLPRFWVDTLVTA